MFETQPCDQSMNHVRISLLQWLTKQFKSFFLRELIKLLQDFQNDAKFDRKIHEIDVFMSDFFNRFYWNKIFYFFDNETKRFLKYFVLFFDHERSWFEFCLKSFRLYRKHRFFCRQDSCFDDKISVRVRNDISWFFVTNEIVLDIHLIRCFWFWTELTILFHWWQSWRWFVIFFSIFLRIVFNNKSLNINAIYN
jgi:hypothetical protein